MGSLVDLSRRRVFKPVAVAVPGSTRTAAGGGAVIIVLGVRVPVLVLSVGWAVLAVVLVFLKPLERGGLGRKDGPLGCWVRRRPRASRQA